MIFFTADTHFFHGNIIRYCGRPFENAWSHDQALIFNWNCVVGFKDTVYHLGDFGFGKPERLKELADKLHGKIHLIKGNHDKNTVKEPCASRFESIKDVQFLTVQEQGQKYEFYLSHYAHRTWPKSHYGVINLYGHSHGNLPYAYNSLDVGVDCHAFWPISIPQVMANISEMNAKTKSVQKIFDTMFGEKDSDDSD